MGRQQNVNFYDDGRGVKTLHIETDGCLINIRVGLTDAEGRRVTRVDVSPDDESRGGDGSGDLWHAVDGPIGGRIVRQPRLGEPGNPAYFMADDNAPGMGYVVILDAGRNVIDTGVPIDLAERDYPYHRPYSGLD